MNDDKRGVLTIHYHDGAMQKLRYDRFSEDEDHQLDIDRIINKAFDANHLVVEKEESLMVIPFTSIKYIEITPAPVKLPEHTIRGAGYRGQKS